MWIFCSFLFGIYNFLFISPGLYNGIYMNWFENPMLILLIFGMIYFLLLASQQFIYFLLLCFVFD
uniref:Uncharacterized protein n=1 Tax=Meloidogyne enterolobii TaxID=390850 RepID=A0A6V7UTQ3_MELEN|nr:unnamed protein product [Meloidogyne enterolobii]